MKDAMTNNQKGSCTGGPVSAKRVLFCASAAVHIRNFHLPYLKAFHDQGWEVWVAVEDPAPIPYADQVIAMPWRKRLFSPWNLLAVFDAWRLLRREHFQKLCVHTTLASVIFRLAALFTPKRPWVAYVCHGYLFRDQGWKRWAYILPEWLAGKATDLLLVMNQEDFRLAKKYHFGPKELGFIPGMGFQRERFSPLPPDQREAGRTALGIEKGQLVLIYGAEFSGRKNQALLLRALAQANLPNLLLLLAGSGAFLDSCKELAKTLGVEEQVRFLGQVADLGTLYPLCDIVVSPSRSEGLPFHLMEAMSCGLPAVATDVKGHQELVQSEVTGYLTPLDDPQAMAQAIRQLAAHPELRAAFGAAGREAVKPFALEYVKPLLLSYYGLDERRNGDA